jgi:hypothetical protein
MEPTESAKLDNKIDIADLGCEPAPSVTLPATEISMAYRADRRRHPTDSHECDFSAQLPLCASRSGTKIAQEPLDPPADTAGDQTAPERE